MRRRQVSTGQTLILILLVLLAVVLIFGILSTLSARVRAAPIVREAFWLVDDQRVSTVKLSNKIEAHVVIKVTEEYVGSIVVKIRKDVAHSFDSDFHISTISVNLKDGEEEIEIIFTPDEPSSSRFFGLRGYFIEVEFRVTRTTWVMENSYPPRLKVTD